MGRAKSYQEKFGYFWFHYEQWMFSNGWVIGRARGMVWVIRKYSEKAWKGTAGDLGNKTMTFVIDCTISAYFVESKVFSSCWVHYIGQIRLETNKSIWTWFWALLKSQKKLASRNRRGDQDSGKVVSVTKLATQVGLRWRFVATLPANRRISGQWHFVLGYLYSVDRSRQEWIDGRSCFLLPDCIPTTCVEFTGCSEPLTQMSLWVGSHVWPFYSWVGSWGYRKGPVLEMHRGVSINLKLQQSEIWEIKRNLSARCLQWKMEGHLSSKSGVGWGHM